MNTTTVDSSHGRANRRRGAFTLIELLVVIAIISLLAAILFPVFAQAREQSRKAACLSNLRQLGMAFLSYTQDNDGGFPNTGDPYLWVGMRWRWPVMPYVGAGQKQAANFTNAGGSPSILICPSDTLSGTGYDSTSYGYSACFYHTADQINAMHIPNMRVDLNTPGAGAACVTQTDSDVAYPSQKAMVGEWYDSHDHTGTQQPVGYWGTLIGDGTPGSDRWTGARCYAFADGHAKFVQAKRMTPSADDCPDMHLTPNGVGGKDLP